MQGLPLTSLPCGQLITIVDPHIKRDPDYYIYKEAQELDILVKQPDGKSEFEGWCWPGSSSWTDWFNPKSHDWWIKQFRYDKYKVNAALFPSFSAVVHLPPCMLTSPLHAGFHPQLVHLERHERGAPDADSVVRDDLPKLTFTLPSRPSSTVPRSRCRRMPSTTAAGSTATCTTSSA